MPLIRRLAPLGSCSFASSTTAARSPLRHRRDDAYSFVSETARAAILYYAISRSRRCRRDSCLPQCIACGVEQMPGPWLASEALARSAS